MSTVDRLVEKGHQAQARFEAREAGCPHVLVAHDDTLDAYYCEPCDIWLEPFCEDSTCKFCAHIPLRPSQRQLHLT